LYRSWQALSSNSDEAVLSAQSWIGLPSREVTRSIMAVLTMLFTNGCVLAPLQTLLKQIVDRHCEKMIRG
jgi:hypothetical protein